MSRRGRGRRPGCRPGPFGGVPFLLKDFGAAYAGAPQTGGSRALRHFVPAGGC
ncbi:MAG: hypothetical protein WKG07_17700 [Hymenobacter sp.]